MLGPSLEQWRSEVKRSEVIAVELMERQNVNGTYFDSRTCRFESGKLGHGVGGSVLVRWDC